MYWELWPHCSLWGCAAPKAACAVLLLPVFAHGSFSLGVFTCVDTRQGLTWQLWCCALTGRSLEWFLILEVVPPQTSAPPALEGWCSAPGGCTGPSPAFLTQLRGSELPSHRDTWQWGLLPAGNFASLLARRGLGRNSVQGRAAGELVFAPGHGPLCRLYQLPEAASSAVCKAE